MFASLTVEVTRCMLLLILLQQTICKNTVMHHESDSRFPTHTRRARAKATRSPHDGLWDWPSEVTSDERWDFYKWSIGVIVSFRRTQK